MDVQNISNVSDVSSIEVGVSSEVNNNNSPELNNNSNMNDFSNGLRTYRIRNVGKIIIATLNINSIRNKFDELKMVISGNIDVLVLTETKLDDSFPTGQFCIEGFSTPLRLDRNRHGGGILIYIREELPSKELTKHTFNDDIEGIFFELNLDKYKVLLLGTYRPPNQERGYYFNNISKSLDLYLGNYERFFILGDLNTKDTEQILVDFNQQYDSKNIVKGPTCLKNVENPSTIDLIITNTSKSCWNTKSFVNGLSDFHALVVTTLNIKFNKPKPREIMYRDYKNFDIRRFQRDLTTVFSSGCNDYDSFENMFLSTLNLHAPYKKKIIRGNHAPYMNRQLRKAIMKRNELQTKYYRTKANQEFEVFKRQRNYVSRLYKKAKKQYYNDLDNRLLLDNKKFWRYIKASFSDKDSHGQKITLVSDNNIVSGDQEQTESFMTFFGKAVDNLEIKENRYLLNYNYSDQGEVENIISKFKYHPSILLIRTKVNLGENLTFNEVTEEEVLNLLKQVNGKKATTFQNIPCKALNQNAEVCAPVLTNIFNTQIIRGLLFPDMAKNADIIPIFKRDKKKKKDATDVQNYRPVSVLPSTSKVFERIIQSQIAEFVSNKLSPYLCGYRKGFSAQHALISLIEHWRSTLDRKGYAGAVLMDLSKAFDCINHELLLAKLNAYGFSIEAIKLIKSYLSNRKQRVKINTSFSSWSELLTGVPQGSVLGPLLFNIYLNDLFWINEQTEVCNLADDTTFFSGDVELNVLLKRLEHDSVLAIEWFESNYMKMNTDKCHLILAGHKHELIWAEIGTDRIWETSQQRLLGITIDNKLRFNSHITELCKTAQNKLSALIRHSFLLNFDKRRTLLKAFIESQFGYSPLVWMFHDRGVEKNINKVHERALRCVYRDDTSTFDQLLKKDNSCSIHHRNIHAMAIEMFKVKNNVGPSLLNEIFTLNDNFNPGLRHSSEFKRSNVRTVHYGKDSLGYFGSIIWDLIPQNIKLMSNLNQFKSAIKKWKPDACPCRLCQTYIAGLGYI